jgi:hypothetical protein
MVHEAAKRTEEFSKGDLEDDCQAEYVAADKLGEKIRENLGLTWEEIAKELDEFSANWKSPGDEINLDFLR